MSQELPKVISETPDYNPADPYHYRKWELAGRPDVDAVDSEGNKWRPSIQLILQPDGETYLPRPLPDVAPITDVEIARQYASAYQAAEDIIFLLMARISMALIGAGLFTPETVNAEGTRFVFFHRAKIEAFKLAGRHPDAGDALYTAIMAPESIGAFSWLDGPIGQIFATGLPRNP